MDEKKKKIRYAIYRRNTRNYGQCRPSNKRKATKFGMRLFNGTYLLAFPIKFCKISNMNVKILRIYEDYVTTTIFTLLLLNGFPSSGGTKFSKPMEEISKKRNGFLKRRHVSLLKFINSLHLRAVIDRFLRSLPLNKPFFIISDSAFTEANTVLEHL